MIGWPANLDLVIGKARTLGRSQFLRLESEAINWRGRYGKSVLELQIPRSTFPFLSIWLPGVFSILVFHAFQSRPKLVQNPELKGEWISAEWN